MSSRSGTLLTSLERLGEPPTDVDARPSADVLSEYRELYNRMVRMRRARAFSTHDVHDAASRERAATERRVMALAETAHRRADAVGIDLHEARDAGPGAVLIALDKAIERHEAGHYRVTQTDPSAVRRRRWQMIVVTVVAVAVAATAAIVRAL